MSNPDEIQSAILKALGDENRIRLMRLISREVLNVQELCEIMQTPQPRVSRHLRVLKEVGLVSDQREGSRVYYKICELDGDYSLIKQYLEGIAQQEHPDYERMAQVLYKRTQESHDFSDQKASLWDEVSSQLHSSTAALLALAGMAPENLKMVDLGTGTGILLPVFAQFASTVYAVDHSKAMLDFAEKRCLKQDILNVKFICSSIADLKIDEPVDCALMHFSLHQMASPAAVIKVAESLLDKGGKLVIVDRKKHDDESAREIFGSQWLGFDEDQILDWLEQAGFESGRFLGMNEKTEFGNTGIFICSAVKK